MDDTSWFVKKCQNYVQQGVNYTSYISHCLINHNVSNIYYNEETHENSREKVQSEWLTS